ncbi:hypothetical protein MesoLjLc_03340 [Mesorhizobium sp. L-8-10]|uniref:nucleotidyl transferase AbiEii/AbiGii toxin family protein n=1 Tax=Mesorhizobium sp. L-8-10 TaxID=2744523 RepID=UPI0019259A97|nr:nucleotidyl transferase AbiEii/AbiGii toxin family protein [Mesorhizobium sp. L-8-10]BCH28404.1 hypothetical protein MesoLjLc_03340 [Mesorhizobium sp. L-8-10]
MTFNRPEHEIIGDALRRMNHQMLMDSKCWFGGGTAIVLRLGEYRCSLDVDFICSDTNGYRDLRNALIGKGPSTLFPNEVKSVRDIRADQYGIRMFLEYRAQLIKFEIVRESRIDVDGDIDPVLQVPTLLVRDMFSEKLLSNSDRCMDRSTAYRDAIDLGRLVEAYGPIPEDALAKAVTAYGEDIERKAVWVVNRLHSRDELRNAAEALQMDHDVAARAIASLRDDFQRIWPAAKIDLNPSEGNDHVR